MTSLKYTAFWRRHLISRLFRLKKKKKEQKRFENEHARDTLLLDFNYKMWKKLDRDERRKERRLKSLKIEDESDFLFGSEC